MKNQTNSYRFQCHQCGCIEYVRIDGPDPRHVEPPEGWRQRVNGIFYETVCDRCQQQPPAGLGLLPEPELDPAAEIARKLYDREIDPAEGARQIRELSQDVLGTWIMVDVEEIREPVDIYADDYVPFPGGQL